MPGQEQQDSYMYLLCVINTECNLAHNIPVYNFTCKLLQMVWIFSLQITLKTS